MAIAADGKSVQDQDRHSRTVGLAGLARASVGGNNWEWNEETARNWVTKHTQHIHRLSWLLIQQGFYSQHRHLLPKF